MLSLFLENRTVYEISKNAAEPDRLQMTKWRMRVTCWISTATRAHALAHPRTLSHIEMCNTYCFSTETVVT